jgi:ribose transport system permease protein
MEISKTAVKKNSLLRSDSMQRVLAFGALTVMIIFFSLASPNFFKPSNIAGILIATAVNAVLGLGVTFVIITSGIDLSIGTVMTLSAVMTGVFIINGIQIHLPFGLFGGTLSIPKMPVFLGVLGGIGMGALAGFINGVIIAKLKVPPFIATLGMLNIAKGLSLVISQLKPIYFNDQPVFNTISMGSVISPITTKVGSIFGGGWEKFEIPNAVLIMFGAAIIAGLILSKTILGRYTFALGSNEEATRLSGVKVDLWKIAVYTTCGLFAGLAGVMIASRLNSAQPALGAGYELDAIAAAVIGGTSLSGGEGTMVGTIIGAFIISVLTNGLRILSVPQEWQTVVTGAIVILAVYLDIIRRRQSN